MPLLPHSDASDGGRFDYGVAGSVRSAFELAAGRLEEHSGSRMSYVSSAKEDFRGHFSEVFEANAATARNDAGALASALRTVAGYVGKMIEAAREEDARRERNNEWVREHNDRNLFEQIGDWFSGADARPNTEPQKAPVFAPAHAAAGSRDTPPPGGGYGGGTSSARPANLRSFAANSRGLDDGLAAEPGSLEGRLSSFESSCYWGSIEASGVLRAYREYLRANENDAKWAVTVAEAFAAAGGEGNVSTLSDAAVNEALAAAGLSAGRSGLVIDPPTAAGAMPTSGYANDPVNTATGNFIEPETDLGFAGAASNLVFSRMYNSLGSGLVAPGVFGPGWASVLDQSLVLSDEGCRWVMADGRAVDFPRAGTGWARAVGENYWLTSEPSTDAVFKELGSVPAGTAELLVVRDNQGTWWAYSPAGVWLGAGSGPGRTVSVLREAPSDGGSAGAVSRLEHVRGRFLEVDYAAGRAAVVRASDGRRVEYGYDAAGRLVSVGTEVGTRAYRWNEAGLVDAVYSAAGVLEAENTYDELGRVILQVTQHGRRVRFAYLPGRVTVVSDEDGTRSNSWIADAKGRLVGVLDSHDQRQSMAYDGHGNLVSFTERDGAVTVHAYDERGRKTRTVTPEGADLTYGWDDQDRITTLVTASGAVVSYEYADDFSRDPAVVLDPLGGRTELVWEKGQLAQVTDPVGVRVAFEYDSFGDLVATCNAAGDVARIFRDQAGRPVTAVSPSGHETRFVYDGAGLLVRREDPDGAVWAFEHDAAGRVTATVAPDGGRTELEYAPNGELVRTIDPLGRSVERVFDELGSVTGVVLPDGAAWGFAHDTLSRLIGVRDPAGHDWAREYDKVGALTAVVDPTGVRTDATTDRRAGSATLTEAFGSATIGFDEFGRPTKVEAADGSAELVTYDAAGNPVELVDGEGGLTVLGRDVAGRITSVTSPAGAVTRYEYDGCGRPWRTTDPLGAVTELAYDADQRVSTRTLPTGEVETFEYDAGGRLIARRTPGQGLSRYGYDRCGRLSFSQDTWYGTRRFKYNTAGELVVTVNGVGGRTRFEYDVRGRLVRITDPNGGVTTRTYTVTDLVDSVTDPLGRVATATYDPAGRLLSQTDPDGHTTTWTYDRAGREATTTVDGKLITSIERDPLRRRVVITDHTGPDGLAVEHVLGFDRCGRLTSRTRGAQGLSWEYDPDGNRTSFTDAHGITTTYSRDAAGQIIAVTNPLLGDAVFTHDAAGRIASATVGDLVQEWAYRNGALAEHTRVDRASSGAADVTLIGRDDDGRITGLTRSGAVTRYGYDGAGQMTSARTTGSGDADVPAVLLGWEYDAGGRLLREVLPGGSRVYGYDAAGQLLSVTEPDGSRTEYVHDGLGRRTRLIGPDGSWTEYAWGPTGHLSETVVRDRDGAEVSRHSLWVDALGELAAVDRLEIWWDTANPVPTLAGIGGGQVLSLPGGITGVGEAWTAPGWRAARPTDQADPWAVVGTPTVPDSTSGSAAGAGAVAGLAGVLPAGMMLTGNGGVAIAGLEWLGARAYDPASRGFLSTDPLAPVLGAGWDGNPYAYAGNNPLNTTDPTGLRPLTDGELQAYDSSARGAMAATGEWLGNNWEYLAGGAMVIAGGALMATGVGGPLGMALVGAGVDTIIQKATTGSVNWGQVALTGAVGLVAGPLAGKVSSAVASGLGRAGTALSTRVLPAVGRAGSAALSGAGRAGTAVSAVGSRVGSAMASGASRAGSAVASAGTRAGSAVVSGVSRVSSTAGTYVSQLPGQHMLRAAVTNGASGSIGNTGMYFVTNPRDEWELAGIGGAAANGFISGAVSSQAGYIAGPLSGDISRLTQYAIGAGGSVAGGAVDKFVNGETYQFGEMVFDGVGGGIATHFPGASDLDSNPGWMTHSFAAYGGAHVGAIVESGKFVGEQVFERVTGTQPW
jgi:RHS repeat-associated protein